MNRKLLAAAAIVILAIVGALVISNAFLSTAPASEVTYTPPPSAVHASLGTIATSSTIALRLNGLSDASNPAMSDAWIRLNREAASSGVYNRSLTPSPGDQYLIANITVTNIQQAQIPFTHAAFVLLTPNNTAYYANYAVCSRSCAAQALDNRTLNETFSSDVYVLFSVPAGTHGEKIVYTASNPPIVMSSI
jgi:Domain of unknown function (DUF4352)